MPDDNENLNNEETPSTDPQSIYGVNDDGEAVLRVSEDVEGDPTSIYGVNSDGEACMRISTKVTSDDPTSIYGVNGSGEACVRIEGSGGGEPINNQDKTITTNGSYTADEGYTGLGTVTVNVPNPSTGTKNITGNGTYDVTDFASANVNVPTTAPAHYIEKTVDANGKLINSSNVMDLTGVTDIGYYTLYYSYYANTALKSGLDMSDVLTITGDHACYHTFQASRIISADLSSLTTVSGSYACENMFSGNSNFTSFDLSSLTTISSQNACASMFYSTRITTASLPSLSTVSGTGGCQGIFRTCPQLTTVYVPALTIITGAYAFQEAFMDCLALTVLSFPAITTTSFGSYTNQFKNMCKNIPNITLHFPSNVQSVIEGLEGYSTTAPFGALAGTVLFDLPATE